MKRQQHCKVHAETKLVEATFGRTKISYCPLCRASAGGLKAASNMSPEQRKERSQKAIAARWNKGKEQK